MANIFREALEILNNKHDGNMTKEEAEIVSSAIIPLMILPQYNHVDLREGLAELARMVEKFCLPRCGKTPDGELCLEAERTHRRFVALLFKSYSRFN